MRLLLVLRKSVFDQDTPQNKYHERGLMWHTCNVDGTWLSLLVLTQAMWPFQELTQRKAHSVKWGQNSQLVTSSFARKVKVIRRKTFSTSMAIFSLTFRAVAKVHKFKDKLGQES